MLHACVGMFFADPSDPPFIRMPIPLRGYGHGTRDFRLADVAGEVVHDIIV